MVCKLLRSKRLKFCLELLELLETNHSSIKNDIPSILSQPEGNDASEEAKQAARESRVSGILEKCKEELETYVTKPLMVPEVRQDGLPRAAVTVDVLKVLSEHLEEQYNTALDIAPEARQCSEDLRERFYYFSYHALQAEHDHMNLKISNLKKMLKEAPKDVKKELKNLMRLRKRRKRLVVKLEKRRPQFSPVSFSLFDLHKVRTLKEPVILRVDSTIYRINHYSLDYSLIILGVGDPFFRASRRARNEKR